MQGHRFILFFFNDTATTEIYTLFPTRRSSDLHGREPHCGNRRAALARSGGDPAVPREPWPAGSRSEEHTSELQSQSNLVCRLLLEKKKFLTHSRWQTTV